MYCSNDDDWEREDWASDEEDAEDWDDDGDPDDEEPTVPCPYCRREIHEDAERCPHCGQYISSADAPAAAKPWWVMIGVAVCLYLVYRWTFG